MSTISNNNTVQISNWSILNIDISSGSYSPSEGGMIEEEYNEDRNNSILLSHSK